MTYNCNIKQLEEVPMSESFFYRCSVQISVSGQFNMVIRTRLADRSIGYTIPQHPRKRLQRYRLTVGERATVEEMSDGNADKCV